MLDSLQGQDYSIWLVPHLQSSSQAILNFHHGMSCMLLQNKCAILKLLQLNASWPHELLNLQHTVLLDDSDIFPAKVVYFQYSPQVEPCWRNPHCMQIENLQHISNHLQSGQFQVPIRKFNSEFKLHYTSNYSNDLSTFISFCCSTFLPVPACLDISTGKVFFGVSRSGWSKVEVFTEEIAGSW